MTTPSDFTLIGGGIIGLLTARMLHQAGATVTVVDKNKIGKESSWAGGGILLPLYPWRQNSAITTLVIESLSVYPSLAAELSEATGVNPEWNPCGLLIVKNPDIRSAVTWCENNHIVYQETSSSLPGLIANFEQPLWLPDIANIRNPRLIQSLQKDLSQRGVKLVDHCEITGIRVKNNRVSSIDTLHDPIGVRELIVTAGAWTSGLFRQFFPMCGHPAPQISPVKGQMLLFKATPGMLPSIVLDNDRYLIPRLDGHILVGSTVENSAFDKTTTTVARRQISEFAYALMPALKGYPVAAHWSGIRPGSPDGVPYIDRHSEIENLYINAGHFRNGLTMAPASAQLMTDLLLNRPTRIDPEPYRFIRSP